jgi:hypothetical protein
MTALDTLTIRHEEPRITITDASGRERVVYTDGRRTQEERSHGGTTQVTARWKEARVEIVSTPQTGPTVTESFAVAADGSTLTVVMKIEGGRAGPVTIRRVYDAVKPALPVAPASPPKEPGGGAGSSPPA